MKVAAAILAAGASRRLGRPKQLEVLGGEALVHRTCRIALETGCAPVMALLGCRAEAVGEVLADLPVTGVVNPAWEEGMASSVRAAVASLPPDTEALLLLVCDQLALGPPILRTLLAAFQVAPDRPAACIYEDLVGVPAIFPSSHFPALARLQGDQGARSLLREGPVTLVPWPAGASDLDSPSDRRQPPTS